MISELTMPFLFGVIFSAILTPIARRVAMHIGAIDNPGERRVHAVATPRLGGPAIFISTIAALLLLALFEPLVATTLRSHLRLEGALVIGALMVTTVGTIDDVRSLRPIAKLIVTVAAASVAVYGGYRIDSGGTFHLGLLSVPCSIGFIVAIVNAVNLTDGLDGLAAGLCLIAIAALLLMELPMSGVGGPTLFAALCGVLIGFLFYNFHPARMFLGDSGALLLGFTVAIGALAVSQETTGGLRSFAPFLVLGLPLIELLLTVLRRLLRPLRMILLDGSSRRYMLLCGRPALFAADREHIHHRLLNLGFSHRGSVLLLYGVGAIFASSALSVAVRPGIAAPTFAGIIVLAFVGIRFVGYRELRPIQSGLMLPLLESFAHGSAVLHAIADAVFVTFSCALAFIIEGSETNVSHGVSSVGLLAIATSQIAVFAVRGAYRRSWRIVRIDDAVLAMKAVGFATLATAIVAALLSPAGLGARFVIIDGYLLATTVLGARLSLLFLESLTDREMVDSEIRASVEVLQYRKGARLATSNGTSELDTRSSSAPERAVRAATSSQ